MPSKFRIEISGAWPGHKSFWIVTSEGACGNLVMTDADFDAFVHALMAGNVLFEIVWIDDGSPYLSPTTSGSRPTAQRGDGRTTDGRSEYKAKLAALVKEVVERWGEDVIKFKETDGPEPPERTYDGRSAV